MRIWESGDGLIAAQLEPEGDPNQLLDGERNRRPVTLEALHPAKILPHHDGAIDRGLY